MLKNIFNKFFKNNNVSTIVEETSVEPQEIIKKDELEDDIYSSETVVETENNIEIIEEKKVDDDIFFLYDKKISKEKFGIAKYIGSGVKEDNNIKVFSGSMMNVVPIIDKRWLDFPQINAVRQDVIEKNVVHLKDGNYVFTQDVIFSSPSLCACVLLGYVISDAWEEWVNKSGQTLHSYVMPIYRDEYIAEEEIIDPIDNEDIVEDIINEYNEDILAQADNLLSEYGFNLNSKEQLEAKSASSEEVATAVETYEMLLELNKTSNPVFDEIMGLIIENKDDLLLESDDFNLFPELTEETSVELEKNDNEKISIDDMNLSVRSTNALKRQKILCLSDLLKYSKDEIFGFQNLGKTSFDEIIGEIEKYVPNHFDDPEIELEEGNTLVTLLDLSVRSLNCLLNAGIKTTFELEKLSLDDLRNLQNLGKKSYEEIVNKMKEINRPLKNVEVCLESSNIDYPDTNYNIIKAMRLIEDVFGKTVTKGFEENKNQEFLKRLNNSLDTLKPSSKEIIIQRYGLITGESMTLQEVALLQNLSRERIRQSVESSIKKLQTKKHTKFLREYLIFNEKNKDKDKEDIDFIMSLME